MLRHIKHAVRHSGFIDKHPVLTFLLAAIGLSTVGELAISIAGKTPAVQQPPAKTT
jgi:hypothetical protein